MDNHSITAFAPATIGNLSCGFDILGLAIEEPGDEVTASLSDSGSLNIVKIIGDNGLLPMEANKNTAGIAVQALLNKLNKKQGIDLELRKLMPIGSGLGSSAASAVAAVFAVNQLLGEPLKKEELLPFSIEAEKGTSGNIHADNVAPSLLGGLILIRSYSPLIIKKIPVPENMYLTLVYPKVEILTKEARKLLPESLPITTTIKQMSNVAGLICGCYDGDIAMIGSSLGDYIAEPVRSKLIPHFDEIRQKAGNAGASGTGISGSGPTIFSISADALTANKVAEAKTEVYTRNNIEHQIFISKVNTQGAVVRH